MSIGIWLVKYISPFTWAVIFILLSNYNFFKRSFPLTKNVYVAMTACVVVSILDRAHDQMSSDAFVYAPFFVAVFARELAFDIPDIKGDSGTLARKFGREFSFSAVMTLYLMALIASLLLSETTTHRMVTSAGFISLGTYFFARTVMKQCEKSLLLLSGMTTVAPAALIFS